MTTKADTVKPAEKAPKTQEAQKTNAAPAAGSDQEALEKTSAAPAAGSDQEAEALEKTNAEQAPEGSPGDLYVFANIQRGMSFKLPGGEVVTIRGFPVSGLKKPGGGFFAGGKYGVTAVPTDTWREVMRIYGKMRIFQSGLVFDAPTVERGEAMARERGGLRHGYEPVDPASSRTKTAPKTED
jgi:hypothetical protein